MINILFILLSIFITTLWVLSIAIMQKEGMILGFIGQWSKKYFDRSGEITWTKYYLHKICKPLFLCPPCCSSVHGVLVYFMLTKIAQSEFNIFSMIIVCVCSVTVVYITNKFID